jgi:hypothetical protein
MEYTCVTHANGEIDDTYLDNIWSSASLHWWKKEAASPPIFPTLLLTDLSLMVGLGLMPSCVSLC